MMVKKIVAFFRKKSGPFQLPMSDKERRVLRKYYSTRRQGGGAG